MSKTDAAYMRQYRARKRAEALVVDGQEIVAMGHDLVMQADALARAERQTAADAMARITELEAEVKHLKAELAKRPTGGLFMPLEVEAEFKAIQDRMKRPGQFNSRPFTPAPKKGK